MISNKPFGATKLTKYQSNVSVVLIYLNAILSIAWEYLESNKKMFLFVQELY